MLADTLKERLDSVQGLAVHRAYSLLKKDGKALIVMTTGTGKTITGSKIIRRYPSSNILWITQTEELIRQTRDDLFRVFNEPIGLFQRKQKTLDCRITVASLQTLEKDDYRKVIPKDYFGLIVVDEAHHSTATSWHKTISYFKGDRLGLTATPDRSDGGDIRELFGKDAITLSYAEAKKMKLIAEETYRVILTNSRVEGITTKNGDYQPHQLDRLIVSENRNDIIVDSYKKYGRRFMKDQGLPLKAICFCITVSHAIRMRDLFVRNAIKAEVLVARHSSFSATGHENPLKESERKEVYDNFLSGEGVEILCVVNVLNEGKNIPDVGVLLMARPTRSACTFQQQLGRGCRRIEGKKERFMVLDFVDQMNEKYPPMTLSRITGEKREFEDIVTEYYRGKDPIVVDELIQYLSPDHPFEVEAKWTKPRVALVLKDFYRKQGFIRNFDLVTSRTGLPNRTTIKRYWPTVEDCLKELRIPWKSVPRTWTKDSVSAEIIRFSVRNGGIRVIDLGPKNGLPSQKVIYEFFGTWKKCLKELKLEGWTNEAVLESIRIFNSSSGRLPKKTQFTSGYGLPSPDIVKKHFGSIGKAVKLALNKAA